MIDRDLQSRFRFFFEHDGWATPPGKAACAIAAARAERMAEQYGISFEMVPDDSPDLSWADERDMALANREGVWGIVAKLPDGEVADSLWGIVGTDPDYIRCTKAGLAMETTSKLYTVTP